jgi:hypothetical protein
MAVMIEAATIVFGKVGNSVLFPVRSMIVTAFVSTPNPDPLMSKSWDNFWDVVSEMSFKIELSVILD